MKIKALGGLTAILLFLLGISLLLAENERVRILRPPDRSVIPFGPVEIAVVVPSESDPPLLALDGKKIRLPSRPLPEKEKPSALRQTTRGIFLPPALIVVCSLSPGLHRLSVGDSTVQFFLRDQELRRAPPSGWSPYVPHPPGQSQNVSCVACHKLTQKTRFRDMNGTLSLQEPSTCFDCHQRADFNLTHNHRYESLAFCQMCHDPHGSSKDHLLKLPQKKACSLCHD